MSSNSGAKSLLFLGKKLFADRPLHIALQRIPGLGKTLSVQARTLWVQYGNTMK